MKYKHRFVEEKVQELFQYYPVVAVTGARQVGKTTLIETLYHDRMPTITFDPVIDIGNARAEPDFFLQNNPPPVFFDEIQYAPELLGSIKRRVDKERRNGLYILSGSQNLSVLKTVAESLAGRVAVLQLYPLCFREIEEQLRQSSVLEQVILKQESLETGFTKKEIISYPVYSRIFQGGYPKILQLPCALISGYWESYMQTYIERDVRSISNIGSLQTFGRFFGILASMTACEFNASHIGRELGVDRKTARAWIEIAEATFQWITIPAYSRNPIKRIAGKQKGYFGDTGFLCYLLRIPGPEAIQYHPLQGSLFETFVFTEIYKTVQQWALKPNFYHFRTYGGAEVDLVLEFSGKLYLIEIKSTANPVKKHCSGFSSFRACFPHEQIGGQLVICAVEIPQKLDERTWAIPWWKI